MKVYVAGPYSKPVPWKNTRKAIDAAEALFDAGHIPYVPHLSHYWDQVYRREWSDWMRLGMAWLEP